MGRVQEHVDVTGAAEAALQVARLGDAYTDAARSSDAYGAAEARLVQQLQASKRAEADSGFAAIDTDESGEIDFDEFLEWWKSNWFVY